MPAANLNREFQLGLLDENSKAIVHALGEIYSNKNLALNSREVTASTELINSDAYVRCDTTSGPIDITLPFANTWSSRHVQKTPLIILHNTGAVDNAAALVRGSNTLSGDNLIRPGEVKVFISDGVSEWVVVASSLAASLVGFFVLKAGDTMTGDLRIQSALASFRVTDTNVVGADYRIYAQAFNTTPIYRIYDAANGRDMLAIHGSDMRAVLGTGAVTKASSGAITLTLANGWQSGSSGGLAFTSSSGGGGTFYNWTGTIGSESYNQVGVINSAGSWIINPSYANVVEFGADPTGATDSAAAIQLALDDTTYAGVYFPKGTYRIDTAIDIDGSRPRKLFGDGPQASVIRVNGAINGFVHTGDYGEYTTDNLTIDGLGFESNNSGALSAIKSTATFSAGNKNGGTFLAVHNVNIWGASACSFLTGIEMVKCPLSFVDKTIIDLSVLTAGNQTFRSGSIGISILSTSTDGSATDICISNTTVLTAETGIAINDSSTSTNDTVEGVHISACTIINNKTSVKIGNSAAGSLSPAYGLVDINGSHLSAQNVCVDITHTPHVFVRGCLIQSVADGSLSDWVGIKYTSGTTAQYANAVFSDNNILDVGMIGTLYGIQIVGNGTQNESIRIHSNVFDGGLTATLRLDSNCNGVVYTLDNVSNDGSEVSMNSASELTNQIDRRGQTTPTPTSSSGTLGATPTSIVDWEKQGRYVKYRITIQLAGAGTGAGTIQLTLPFTASTDSALHGQRASIVQNAVMGIIAASSTTLTIRDYAGNYPGAANEIIILGGMVYV